jgi:hypothetical protein
MNRAARLLLGPAFLLALIASHSAQAQLTTINCNTAVHIADFTSCAQGHASGHGLAPGKYWYVTYNADHHTAVQVTAVYFARSGHVVYSPVAYQPGGALALTDSDLGVSNASLIDTINVAGGIPGLNIDPNQVYSLLNVEFPEILTNQIDAGLSAALGDLYSLATPVGTVVMVTCTGDGTNAQYIRISMTATVQWEMKPGTLKNKAGQFIDSSGNVIGHSVNNLGSPGFQGALPNFPGNGLAPGDWSFWSPLPGVTITVGNICDPNSPC